MNKHHLLVGIFAIALVSLLRIDPAFAAGEATTGAATTTSTLITELLGAIIKFLSWGWMLLAFLAGKLMSNDFIYGTFIHLDSALFKLWNYMKNIANFLLGFLFLFGILKSLFSKDAFELKKVLPKYLIAGVLIQMSWFIMGAFVDLANVATAAVGAFPTQFIQGSTDKLSRSKMMQLAVTVPEKITVSFKPEEPLFSSHTGTQTIEEMFGKFNNMSGPLLFLGASIFRFQDYDITNADITNRKNFSIGLFLKLFLLVAFCVPLFVLIVINLIRIFKLRIWITFSPLAAIARSFEKETPGFINDMGAQKKLGFGKLSDVISLIFQPVVMIGSLALVMILSIGMFYVLGGDPGDASGASGGAFSTTLDQLQVTSKGTVSTLKDNISGTEISIDGDLFKGVGSFVGGMIGYLIITGFTIVLIWSLIKITSSFSVFTKNAADNIFKWSEKLVTNANIVPLGGAKTSIAALKQQKNETMRELTSGAYANKKIEDQTTALRDRIYNTDFGKGVKKTFGIQDSDKTADIDKVGAGYVQQAESGGTTAALQSLKQAMKDKNVTPSSRNFQQSFSSLMNNNKSFNDFMLKAATISETEYKDNKANILNPDNVVGQRMLKALAYVLNKDVKEGSQIDDTKIKEFLDKELKTQKILSTTPLQIQKA